MFEIFEIIEIPINNLKNYSFKFKFISYLSFIISIISIAYWYIFYSEPLKIYRIDKVTPIQYKL